MWAEEGSWREKTSSWRSKSGEVPHTASSGSARALSLFPRPFQPLTGSENLKFITHSKYCHQPKKNHL